MTTLIETNQHQNQLIVNAITYTINQVKEQKVNMSDSDIDELILIRDMINNTEPGNIINSFVS